MTSSRDEVRAKLMDLQAGKCALCPATRRLSVDHDHDTGFARGLLCQSCNSREGHGRDHADIIAYRANPLACRPGCMRDLPVGLRPPGETAALHDFRDLRGRVLWYIT